MKIVETSIFKSILGHLKAVQERKEFYFICADSGLGKTTTFEWFAEHYPGDTIVLSVKPAETMKLFMAKLLSATTGESFEELTKVKSKAIHQFIEESSFEIVSTLNNPVIIIDEAGNFKRNYIPYIRQMADNLKGAAGFVIAAPSDFKNRLEKWSQNSVPGISELLTRIDYVAEIAPPTFQDFKLLASAYGIKKKSFWFWLFERCDNFRTAVGYILRFLRGEV